MRSGRLLVAVLSGLLLVAGAATGAAATGRTTGASGAATARLAAATGWCGGADETAVDRPDVVGGNQVHVVYAHATDVPDHFAEDAPKIVRDLAGVDAWWRGQDPTRTPRFDLAPFLFCDSTLGALDLSSVQLASTDATYRSLGMQDFADRVGSELATALRAANPGQQFMNAKKYLVYLDAADSFDDQCGVTTGDRDESGPSVPSIVELQPATSLRGSCELAGFGSGTGYPASTAAHELVHNLDMDTPVRPHACFLQPEHVCDSSVDLMYGGNPPVSSISEMHLDVGHDDYYGTPGPQYDVRTSAWLSHLDAAPRTITVSATPRGAGAVHFSSENFACADRCTQTFDGTPLPVWAEAGPGYAFDGWVGACASDLVCNGPVTGDLTEVARFVRLVPVPVTVKGRGRVDRIGEGGAAVDECRHRCSWPLANRSEVVLVAHPAPHMVFAGWQGRGCGDEHPRCAFHTGAHDHPVAVFQPA